MKFTSNQYQTAHRLAQDIGSHHKSHREVIEALLREHPNQDDVILPLAHGIAVGKSRWDSMPLDDDPRQPRSQMEVLQRLSRVRNLDPSKRFFNELADALEGDLPKYDPQKQ